MTPFGRRMRELRAQRKVRLKDMAASIGVSSAYLSALEHGHRSRPSWYLVQRIIVYFDLIWDDAEDLVRLANRSHPRVTIDTSGLVPEATEFANLLADRIGDLDADKLRHLIRQIGPHSAGKPVGRL